MAPVLGRLTDIEVEDIAVREPRTRMPGLGGTVTDLAVPETSTSITLTALFDEKSDANVASVVLWNFVSEPIEAVTMAPVSGRLTDIEVEETDDNSPFTITIVW